MSPEKLKEMEKMQADIGKASSRLREMQAMTPKQLADLVVKPPKLKADSALEDIVASVV
jgi:hypothetical protein